MQDGAAYFRFHAVAYFHRRRQYPLGSEDRRHTVEEARVFLRMYGARGICRNSGFEQGDDSLHARTVNSFVRNFGLLPRIMPTVKRAVDNRDMRASKREKREQ
jgi:hypothetical protein